MVTSTSTQPSDSELVTTVPLASPVHSPETPRKVVTPTLTPSQPSNNVLIVTNSGASESTPLREGKTISEVGNKTPFAEGSNSQLSSTPRLVVTNPDSTELETANVLLQLDRIPDNLDAEYDNAELLTVDTEPLEDFACNLKEQEEDVGVNPSGNHPVENDGDTDSDKTVDYTSEQQPARDQSSITQKGKLSYKHYRIRRSPITAPTRNLQCYYCEVICHSKREMNNHHKAEHTTVKCPDCTKVFPTPDALQCHKYIHQDTHRYKCALFDKICAFKSDLDMHMLKHVDDKKWYSEHDGCSRDFKRKSDLTAHEVVHTGEDFICKFPHCKYTNKDPWLLKWHQRVHTKEAKVCCPHCPEKFVFYQQMKHHKKNTH